MQTNPLAKALRWYAPIPLFRTLATVAPNRRAEPARRRVYDVLPIVVLALGVVVPKRAHAQPRGESYRLESITVYASAPAIDDDITLGAASAVAAAARRSVWNAFMPARGITTSAQVITDFSHHRNPLERQRAVQGRALSTVTMRADLDSAVGWSGLTLVVSGMSFTGADQTGTLGTANGGTSIDAPPFRALGEAWAEQRLAGGLLRIKAGRIDANSEFATSVNAGGFLRPGAGLDPTMAVVMPTYPLPARGVNAFVQLSSHIQLSGGIYDGRPSAEFALGGAGAVASQARFGIAELGVHGDAGRLVVGAWRHTSDFSPLLGEVPDRPGAGLTGVYAVADRPLVAFDPDGERSLNVFAQLGLADRRLSDVDRHASIGLTATGPSLRRPADHLGLALSVLSVGEAGARLRAAPVGARETHVEFFYAVHVLPWLTAVPNVHFIPRPVGRTDGRDATAFTVRFAVTR